MSFLTNCNTKKKVKIAVPKKFLISALGKKQKRKKQIKISTVAFAKLNF